MNNPRRIWISAIAGLIVLLCAAGSWFWLKRHLFDQKSKCLHNLVQIDHVLNCIAPLEQGLAPGTLISVDAISNNAFRVQFRCPCGDGYNTNLFVVGGHPKCPQHGDLIGEVGYVPHANPEFERKLK